MTRTETITVRNRRSYRVDISRLVEEVPEPSPRGLPSGPNDSRRPRPGAIVGRLHDGGSTIATRTRAGDPTDLVNRYQAQHYESSPFPSISEIDVVRRKLELQASYGPVTYEHSGRESYGDMVPIAANEETDGVSMGLFLERRKFDVDDPQAKRSYGVNSSAGWIHPMRTPAEQLADFEATAADIDPVQAAAHLRRITRLQYESFDADTRHRAQRDLAFVPNGLSAGMYCPSVSGGLVYSNADPMDTVNYHTTREAYSGGPAAVPWMPVGDGVGTVFDMILEPKLVRIMFRWVSVFLVQVLFAPPTLVAEVNIGAYTDRLPLGLAYRDIPEQSINDTYMSNWIRESNRYAVALQQDVGSQQTSPYYIKILLYRLDGLWQYFRPGASVGDLAAMIDIRRGGHASRVDRYRVYRKTAVEGGEGAEGVQGYGSLGVAGEVIPHDKEGPTFTSGAEYGPF